MYVLETLERTITGMGYELVDFERIGRGLVRVFIDKPGGVSVDDCASVSNQLTRIFSVERLDYDRLEVSSPGLDRRLRKLADFERFRGEKVRIRLRVARQGQRVFTGTLGAVKQGQVELDVDGQPVLIDLNEIGKARLVPNL